MEEVRPADELKLADTLVGEKPTREGVEDFPVGGVDVAGISTDLLSQSYDYKTQLESPRFSENRQRGHARRFCGGRARADSGRRLPKPSGPQRMQSL